MSARCAGALAALLLAASGPAHATDVLVRVSGVVGNAGLVRVSVCTRAEYASRDCAHKANASAHPGTVSVTVPAVPPGDYAVIAHHDRSGDGVVHTNWLGIPTDGVGVSRNATARFGPPGFDAVALAVSGPAVEVEIALRQEPAD